MPKLILMNVGTEQMLGGEFTAQQRSIATKAGWRQLWFAQRGDVIVAPSAPGSAWLQYIGSINEFDADAVSIIEIDEVDGAHEVLSEDRLLSSALLERVHSRIGDGKGWSIMAGYYSAAVVEFADLLGVEPPPGAALAGERGTDLFNRKSHFRRLAAGIGLPVPAGSVALDAATLERAIRRHIGQTGTAIVKQDNNVFGLGNVAVTTRPPDLPLAGVRDVIEVGDDVSTVAESLWAAMSGRWSPDVVVESYHQAAHIMYAEYEIGPEGVPRLLNMGTLRMAADPNSDTKAQVWLGLEIPARLPPFAAATMAAESSRLATRAASLGFRGLVNIDAILTETGQVLFNEVNGRWGGNSILHTLSAHLLGASYADRACVTSRRNIAAVPLPQALEALRAHGLAWVPGGTEGVLVLAIDETFSNTMECLIAAPSWGRVHELETRLLAVMASVAPVPAPAENS